MADALSTDGANAMLDSSSSWPPSHLGAHTGAPGTSGSGEASGAPYARQPASWAAASNRSKALSGDATIPVPAGTFMWISGWTALTAGTYLGCLPMQGDLDAAAAARRSFVVPDATTDVLESPAHGFANGDMVVVWAAGGTLPAGLAEQTVYHVRDVTTDDFKLAATSGGAAVNLTGLGSGQVQRIVPETFAAPGSIVVKAGAAFAL